MPRWKTTQNILKDFGEHFEADWMNFDRIAQYAPPVIPWDSARPMQIEDVDLWEVITETSGPAGVYAAYMPYGETYMVTDRGFVKAVFNGWDANKRLETYLIANGIAYPKGPDTETRPFEKSFSMFT
ncbi:hypothetical protein UFOVP199_25 [uncultured Caudovirales phage]|uniref:Uncharacterized protein n=1 Tax=uncultured Caudovirales phage TaxID=2100421 RepID=A0A6J7WLR2_9CAUD|nr:hypothetical protein UFOVP199_25 [uncultured Caudovirales phage]